MIYLDSLLLSLAPLLAAVAAACLVVVLAMVVDLLCGLHKARLRGERRTSDGLRRSVGKFVAYMGSMLLAAGIDVLLHLSRLLLLTGFPMLYGLPLLTCLMGIFLLLVEIVSIRERADEKVGREMDEAVRALRRAARKVRHEAAKRDKDA